MGKTPEIVQVLRDEEQKGTLTSKSFSNNIEKNLNCQKGELFFSIAENALDAILIANDSQQYVYANSAACKLTGYSKDELLKMDLSDITPIPKDVDAQKMWNEFIKTGRQSGEFQIKQKNGEFVFAEFRAVANVMPGLHLSILRNIDDRKKAQEELKLSEEKYRTLFENINSGVAVYEAVNDGEDFVFSGFNRAAEKIEDVKREELIGKNVTEVFPGVKDFGLFDVFQRVYETGKKEFFPQSFYSDGRIKGWRESWIYKLPNNQIVAVYDDVTEKKQAEKELKDSEKKYKSLIENLSEIVYKMSLPDGTYEYVSPGFEEVFGYSVDVLLKNPKFIQEIIHPDFKEYFSEKWKDLLDGKLPPKYEYKIIDSFGKERWILQSNNGIYDDKGNIIAIEGICRDITEDKQVEERLKESERLLRDTNKMAKVGGWEINLDNNTVFWTDETKRMHGVDQDYIPKLDEAINFFHPDSKPIIKKAVDNAINNNECYDLKLKLISAKGNEKWIRTIGMVDKKENGKKKVYGIIQDITDLTKAEEKYENLFETMAEGVVYQNSDGEIISANPAAERILGLSLDQMQGRTSMDPRWRVIDREKNELPGDKHPAMIVLKTGKPVKNFIQAVFNPKKNEHIWMIVNSVPKFKEDSDKPYQVYSTFLDITEQVRIEEDLKERIKELNGLYRTEKLADETDDFQVFFNKIVNDILPNAMQFIDEVVAKIEFDGKTYYNVKKEPKCYLYAPIKINEKLRGKLTVGYIKDLPFIEKFEQTLIDTCANKIQVYLENLESAKLLKISKERYRSLIEESHDWVYISDFKGNLLDANPAALKGMGYTREELKNLNFTDILEKGQLIKALKETRKLKRTKIQKETIEYKVKRKDGSFRYLETRGSLLYKNGKPYAIQGIARDVTDKKLAEEKLRESEEKYRNIVDLAPDGIITMNLKGVITSVNPSFTTLTGFSNDEIVGKHYKELPTFFKQDIKKYSAIIKTFFTGGTNQPFDFRWKNKKGENRIGQAKLSLMKTDGKRTGIQAIIRDVTEEKNAEEKIKYQHKEKNLINKIISLSNKTDDIDDVFNEILKESLDFIEYESGAIYLIDKNKNTAKVVLHLGLSPEFIDNFKEIEIDKQPYDHVLQNKKPFFICDNNNDMPDIFSKFDIKSIISVPIVYQNKSIGSINLSSTHMRTIDEKQKNTLLIIGTEAGNILTRMQNELKIKKINEELQEKVKERTETVEQLLKQKDEFINQLSHDLKNPLTPLATLLPIIKKKIQDEEVSELVDVAARNTKYIQNLVKNTLHLARLNSPATKLNFEEFNLLEQLQEIITKNKFVLEKNRIILDLDFSQTLKIQADRLKIEELFDNLISNSIKYSPEKSIITIKAEDEHDFVKISITDEGVGMTEEQIQNIFSEFYKVDESRSDYLSTGLGLSICKKIVEHHGGKIWAESPGPGKGSTFYFILKKSQEENETSGDD